MSGAGLARDLDADLSALQWVVDAYTLVSATASSSLSWSAGDRRTART